MRKSMIALVCGLVACIKLNAQAPVDRLVDSLETLVANALPTNVYNPGLVVSVYVPGQWEWSGAAGKAITGITNGYPAVDAQPNDQFRVGSITKIFMATAIMMLEENGDLTVEDDIALHLRASLVLDTIDPSATVRIRHLLNHTSGIGNLADNDSCRAAALGDLTRTFTLEEAIFCGAGQGEYFPPDFAWGYSNTNYALLAMIIKNVTGVSAATYIQSNIIDVLNLTSTGVPSTDELQGAHMGCYWELPPMIDFTVVDASLYHGWADIVATPEDLNTFYHALLSEQLIGAASLAKMQTIAPVSWDYGYGMEFYDIDGDPYFGHSGDVGNTSGLFFSDISTSDFPDGYYVAYNYTYEGVAPYNVLDKPLHDLMMNFVMQPEDTATTPVSIDQVEELLSAITLFPNPANDYVMVRLHGMEVSALRLVDMSGRVIDTYNPTQELISLSNVESGIYLVEAVTEHGLTHEKLVIRSR